MPNVIFNNMDINSSSKFQLFTGDEDSKKSKELSDKVLKQINGYSLDQITESFRYVKNKISNSLVIDTTNLFPVQDENQ